MKNAEVKIMNEIISQIGNNSRRDKVALELATTNVKIEKDGRYYIVKLFDKEVKIACNKKYLYSPIYDLVMGSKIFNMAKKIIKQQFTV